MQMRKSYIGTRNGIAGIWCDFCPEDVEVKEVITYYQPDEGKIFQHKITLETTNFVDESEIDQYEEVDLPQEELVEE